MLSYEESQSNQDSEDLSFIFIYLFIYSQLSLPRIPRDSLKYFEIFVPRHIRVERVRKTIN